MFWNFSLAEFQMLLAFPTKSLVTNYFLSTNASVLNGILVHISFRFDHLLLATFPKPELTPLL